MDAYIRRIAQRLSSVGFCFSDRGQRAANCVHLLQAALAADNLAGSVEALCIGHLQSFSQFC